MNVPPPGQQYRPSLANDPHRATHLAARHTIGPDQVRRAIGTQRIDLGLTVTEDVDVRRRVIINENDDAQAMGAKDGDHSLDNRT
jgi:hypothetical protein